MFWAEAPSSFGQKKDAVETSTCRAQTVSLNSAQMQLAIDLQERSKIPSRNAARTFEFYSAGANNHSEVLTNRTNNWPRE